MSETVDTNTGEILQEEDIEAGKSRSLVRVQEVAADLERRRDVAGVLRPVEGPAELLAAHESNRELITQVLKEGRDYGIQPGWNAKRLLRPGSQRIAQAYGCSMETELVDSTVDHDKTIHWEKKRKKWKDRQFVGWERESGTSVGFYRYVARCRLRHRATGVVVGEGWGVCSTLEDRYVDRPRDLEHTIMQMAKKRAEVDAVLTTFALSEQFEDEAEGQEKREELSYDEQLKIARGRYFALLAEVEPLDRVREYFREAFQRAHRKVPDSSAEWELKHFQRAIADLEKFGVLESLQRAVKTISEQDPAGAEDVELLDAAIDGLELPEEDAGLVSWLRWAGVRQWLRWEAERLSLTDGSGEAGGKEMGDSERNQGGGSGETTTEEPEDEDVYPSEEEYDDELPF